MNAYEWGLAHGSCAEALEWRKSLGETATQVDAWRLCYWGGWLFWQLERGLTEAEYVAIRPRIQQVLVRIVGRAIRRGFKALRGVEAPWATKWRQWAAGWLSGRDRSVQSAQEAEWEAQEAWEARWLSANQAVALVAWEAAKAAAEALREALSAEVAAEVAADVAADARAARRQELRLQAQDLRREIPVWPGG